MGLIGNRGRFSSDNQNFNNNLNDQNSVLSFIGKNPNSLFKIDKSTLTNKVNNNNENVKKISKHEEYNIKLSKINSDFDDKYSDNYYDKKSKKHSIKLIVAMFIVELLTIVVLFAVGTYIRLMNMTQKVGFEKEVVKNTNIDESTLAVMKGFKTVAIFGVDSRTGSVDKGNNADVNLIANLNLETGDAQLVSVYRDLYLSVSDQNTYDKLNAAYRRGGPQGAVKALNKNLDLNIENFFSFNWKAVADGIELLGGIDLEITKSEFKYMNAFIHETCIATGIDSKNPAAHYIKKPGMQHLDGVQAVAYGRLRLMDSDFQRVERQKKVIALCLEKAKKLDISQARLILEAVLPQIAYEFDMNELLSIFKIIKDINIVASCGFPETNNIVMMDMGPSGDCVVPLNLEKAVKKLHKVLFNVDDYVPSNAVKKYSNRITELRKKYEQENLLKASIKQSEEDESVKELLTSSTKKKATKSQTTSKSKATSSTTKNSSSNVDLNENESIDESNTKAVKEVREVNPNLSSETGEVVPIFSAPVSSNYPVEPEDDSLQGVVISGPPVGSVDVVETTKMETDNRTGPVNGAPSGNGPSQTQSNQNYGPGGSMAPVEINAPPF